MQDCQNPNKFRIFCSILYYNYLYIYIYNIITIIIGDVEEHIENI